MYYSLDLYIDILNVCWSKEQSNKNYCLFLYLIVCLICIIPNNTPAVSHDSVYTSPNDTYMSDMALKGLPLAYHA